MKNEKKNDSGLPEEHDNMITASNKPRTRNLGFDFLNLFKLFNHVADTCYKQK